VSEDLRCAGCDRSGTASEVWAGWTFSRPPRPVGRTVRRDDEQRATVHCPECSRRSVRDVEARLDP
jgi:hypothetical protein